MNHQKLNLKFLQSNLNIYLSTPKQTGQLYIAHHIWHYDDLQNRKDVRESAWRKSGWDEIVGGTGKI